MEMECAATLLLLSCSPLQAFASCLSSPASLASSNSIDRRLPLLLASSPSHATSSASLHGRLRSVRRHHHRTTAAALQAGVLHGNGARRQPWLGCRRKQAAPQSQPPAAGGGVAESIMPHLLNIYGSCATARDLEIYAPNATFEDPLMRAHGVKQIKSAFYTLPKVFGEYIQDHGIHARYKRIPWGRAKPRWDKKPLKNRDTVGLRPLVGRLAESSRRGAMLLTHALIGFGKDPKPTQHNTS